MVEKQMAAKTKAAPPKTPQAIVDMANQQAERMRQRSQQATKDTEKLKQIGADLQDALARRDVDQVKILSATFETARASAQATSRDLAQVIKALGDQYKDIGIEIAGLKEFNEEEKKILDDAKELLARAEAGRRVADEGLIKAQQKWSTFGIRERAVQAAEADIEAAKSRVDGAQAGVEAAKQLANQKQRDRLSSADMSTSLQRLQTITQQVIDIASGQIGAIEEDLAAVDTGLEDTSSRIEDLTGTLEGLTQSLEGFEANLNILREQLNEHAQGSSERATLEKEIIEKTRERDQTKAEHTKNFLLLQESQRFIEQYKLHATTQRQNLEYQKAWVALLEMAVKERTVLFDSHIGAMQYAANQEAMKTADGVGAETDYTLAGDMAQLAVAGERALIERVERAPEDTKRLRAVLEARTKSRAEFEDRLAKADKLYQQNYGTPEGYDSVVGHREKDSAAAA